MNDQDIAANFIISSVAQLIITYSYFKSALTDPVQTDLDPYLNIDPSISGNPIADIEQSKYSFCEFCQKKKHQRCSHCKVCKKCVLRRDHHCVWIGNCVGYNNNQYFVNFCLWVTVRKYS